MPPGTPTPPSKSRVRRAALLLVCALALLVIAPAAGAASTRTSAPTTAQAASATATRPASFAASDTPGTRVVLAKADPCAALFGSVKQACENFGKSSGSGSKTGSGSSGSTSVLDIPGQVEQAVDGWFGNLVKSALTPVMNLFGELIMATPNLTGGRVSAIWGITLAIADTVFVLMVVLGGVIVMSHETVQTRYSIKQILPRLIVGFIAANSSLLLISHALTLGNALTLAVWDGAVPTGAGIGNQLLGYILTSIFLPDGVTQVFMVLFGLVVVVLALAVLFSLALRTGGLLLLVILAPPMLLCHGLPGLDAIAFLWWRLMGALMAIGFLQASVLMLMMQVFFDPDSNVFGVPTSAGLLDLVVCGALFVILLKIPGWVLRMALGRAPRMGAMGLIRTAAVAAIGTAIGAPGAGSARALAGRLTGRAVSSSIGTSPTGPRPGPRPSWTRRIPPNFGTAHGRPTAGGQGVLFPIPKGARLSAEQVRRRAAIRSGQARGGWRTAPPVSATGPRSEQPALFDRAGNITPAADPRRQESRRTPRARQDALFRIPEGARLTRAQARQRQEQLQPSRQGWHPEPAPGRSPYRQPALFNRKGALHPDVKNAATPRPKAVPATPPQAPTPPKQAAASTSKQRPVSGATRGRSPVPQVPPPPVSGAPSAVGRTPQPPPASAPRMVPVRMAAAPKPRKRRRNRSQSNGGEQP
jgi:hypothetical protein